MKRDELRERQAKCKALYQENPDAGRQTLTSLVVLDFDNLACNVLHPTFLSPAGLHPSGGGDGTFACAVEMLLAGLASCAGVTLTAVATSMQLQITSGRVLAEGDIDFSGTLAVSKTAPVGLTALRLVFELETAEPDEKIEKLLELTHRYCVVHRTLDAPPSIEVKRIGKEP
jgi:uncharacterized OsmC-like protein